MDAPRLRGGLLAPLIDLGHTSCGSTWAHEVRPRTQQDKLLSMSTLANSARNSILKHIFGVDIDSLTREVYIHRRLIDLMRHENMADLSFMFEDIVRAATSLLDGQGAILYLLDSSATQLTLVASVGVESYYLVPGFRLGIGEGVAGWTVQSGMSRLTNDYASDYQRLAVENKASFRALAAAPLVIADRVIGVLEVFHTDNRRFTSESMGQLQSLASQAALAIRNAQLLAELRESDAPSKAEYRRVHSMADYHSVFISYGGPDQSLAERIESALSSYGAQTFIFSKHAVPGVKLHRLMRNAVSQYDRVLLLCSRSSLNRPGVLNEIEEALQREAREGGSELLIPVALDDYVFDHWAPARPDLAEAVRARVVADFRDGLTNQAAFDAGVAKLLVALQHKG